MRSLFAGLDVSDKTTAICIVDAQGGTILEASVLTTPDAIADALKPYRKKLRSVGQESGNLAPWLEHELVRAKLPMVCLDAAKANASLKTRLNKTDTNDAHGLALILATGIYCQSHVKSVEAIRIRAVLMLRESIVRKGRDLAGVIRMTEKRLRVDKRSMEGATLRSESAQALRTSFAIVKASAGNLLVERSRLDKIVLALARENDVCQRLMTIPGVGPIAALTFYAAVDDPGRFKSSRNVGPYFGLTPKTFQSGASSRSGGISHRGDSGVRKALYAAGLSMVTRSGADTALRRWGRRLARTKGSRIAYVAVARKLAVLMHHLWVTGEDFDPSK